MCIPAGAADQPQAVPPNVAAALTQGSGGRGDLPAARTAGPLTPAPDSALGGSSALTKGLAAPARKGK